MPNNQSETEQVANTAKETRTKFFRNLLHSKFLVILLIIVSTIILLVVCLMKVLDYDTSDKSSKINGLYNKDFYNEYRIC